MLISGGFLIQSLSKSIQTFRISLILYTLVMFFHLQSSFQLHGRRIARNLAVVKPISIHSISPQLRLIRYSSAVASNSFLRDERKPSKHFVPFPFDFHEEIEVEVSSVSNLGIGVARVTLTSEQLAKNVVDEKKRSSKKPQTVEELDEDDLTSLSSAPNSWVIFVPKTIAGERVRVRIHKNFKSYSEADLISIIRPSPSRTEPKCQYFTICGGCQYQHISIEEQRKLKTDQVVNALKRIGKIPNAEKLVHPIVGTNDLYGYRAKITPHYESSIRDDTVQLGFQEENSNIMVDIEKCIITTPNINAKLTEVRNNRKHVLEEEKLALKELAEKTNSTAIAHRRKRRNSNGFKTILGSTILFREVDDGYVATQNHEIVQQTVLGVTFRFQAGDFFQNNLYVLPLMIKHVIKQANESNCCYLVDTYCGNGLFALTSAKDFSKVYGIEVSKNAVRAARENARFNNITNAIFYNGSSEAIFSEIRNNNVPPKETVVVIDPPRKGCDQAFLSQLISYQPKAVIYVSCDPATQARDAQYLLQHSYEITNVTPFDLFPQTRHIENVMTFKYKG